MSRVLDEHRQYLADAVRVSAYESALAEVVRPTDVVLDLGSGTGILGLLACRAGARRVYAIDDGGMAQPARAIVHANGLDDRIQVIDGLSTAVDLPERADLLVTDQIGQFGFNAGIVGYVADARRRLLKPGARLVPSRIDLLVAPVNATDIADAVDFWSRRPAGFLMDPIHDMTMNSGHPCTLAQEQLLGAPQCGGRIDLSADTAMIRVKALVPITRMGTLTGVGGWFSASLSPHVTMSNSPLAEHPIGRRAIVFPIGGAVPVVAADRVDVDMRIRPDNLLVTWTVQVYRGVAAAPIAQFRHSTLHGMLLAPERVHRTHPDYVPHLTARGRARLSVLELCDGRRPLTEIERDVYDRHRSLFEDRAAAAFFVAEVVSGYSE